MKTTRRGISTTGIVVIIAIVVAVVVGGLFVLSPVYHTRMKGAWNDFSQWTPENIAKDPEGYLNFCEDQTNKAITKLKASEIAIAQNKAKFESQRDDAKSAVEGGSKQLDELKDRYRSAEQGDTWPIKWANEDWDKERAKKQIVRMDKEIRGKASQLKWSVDALTLLDAQKSKLQDARDKASEQLASIQTNREQLKMKAITDDLKNQLVAMKGVLQTSVVGVADDSSGTKSLDDLTAKTGTKVDDQEFTKIMGGTH